MNAFHAYRDDSAPPHESSGDHNEPVGEDSPAEVVIPAPSDPMAVARRLLSERYQAHDGTLLLRHHRGDFFARELTHWAEAEERRVRADLYEFLEQATFEKMTSEGVQLVPWEPNRKKVADVLEALQAVSHLGAIVTPPAWVGGHGYPPASEMVPMQNGLLHMPTRTLLPHTPHLFAQHALAFAYEPDAAPPERWLKFLDELWLDDQQAKDTLAEMFGYVQGGSTNQQKIPMVVGPKRGGKGTIARVLTGLLGPHNVAAPTLASLTTNFGLSPLIGKPLAVMSDARLSNRADAMVAVERLLSISGEDSLTIDRKYREPWTGRLPTRFVILTNELPRFLDSSGALASRFILLVLRESFYGREDPGLTDQLLECAPGILNWALAGLDRLTARGHFVQPESAREAVLQLEDLSSPVGAFVRDRCRVGRGHEISKDRLYEEWKAWCELEGKSQPGTKEMFARDLRAAVPGLVGKRARDRATGERPHLFVGVALRPLGEAHDDEAIVTHPDPGGRVSAGQGDRTIVAPTRSVTDQRALVAELSAAFDASIEEGAG